MAKKTQTELLEGILLLLDQTLGETKKKNKAVGDSNAPKGAGVVNAKDISVKAVGNALSVISSAVPKLAKISEKQYDTVAKGIENLATAINSFKMDKDTLAAIGNTVAAFNQIHNVISGMSENFIKSILSLNPIKAWVLGKRLGKFYGILAQGMVGTFVKQIVDIINQVPPNKNVNSKTFKERLVNFGLMMTALLQIKEKQIMQLWMMGVFLGPKNGAAIGGFFKELIGKLAGGKNSVEKANAAAKVALSLVALVGSLTLSLIALVILWKTNDIKDVLGGFGLLTMVVAFAIGIIKILGSKWFKSEKNEGLQGTKDVLLLIGGLTLSAIALVLVAKKAKLSDVAQGIMMLTTVVAFATGILLVLRKQNFKKNASEGLKSLEKITLLIGALTLSVVALALVAKNTKWTDVVQGIMMLGAVVAFAMSTLLVLGKGSFKKNAIEGLKSLDKIMLIIGGLTLSVIALVLVAEKTKWTDVVQGIMMVTAVMSFTLGIIKMLGSKWFKSEKNEGLQGIKDILLLIGGLTLSAVALVLVAEKTKWTDLVQGIISLTAVMAFAMGTLLVLGKESFKKNALDGLKSIEKITLLIGGLTLSAIALVLVAEKTKWTDVVQGIMMLTAIMGFAIGTLFVIGKESFKKNALDGLKSLEKIMLLIGELTLALAIVTYVAKKTKWQDMVQGILMLTTITTFAIGIIKLLSSKWFKQEKNDGLSGIKEVLLLISGLTLSMAALVLVAKKSKWTDVVQGIMMLTAITTFAIGIIKLLSSKWFKQEKNEGLQSTKDVLLLIGGLTLVLAIVTYVAEKTKLTNVVQGIMMLTAITAFALGIIKMLGSKRFNGEKNEGLQGIKDILLLISGLTLSLTVLVLVAEKTKQTNVVQGIIMLGAVVAFAKGILLILGKESFNKNATDGLKSIEKIMLLIGGLTLALAIVTYVAEKTKWTDVVQGILMLTAVMSFALGILLVLGKESFKKDALEGLQSIGKIMLLISGLILSLTVLVLVAKKTKWTDVVQGIIMLGSVVAFALGLIQVLSRESFQKNAVKGLIGVGAIILLIAGVSAAMLIFAEYVKKIDGVKKESAWRAFGLMWAVIGGMAALATVIGAIWSTGIGAGVFAAAFVGVEMIAAMIASVSGAILLFVDLIEKTKALTKSDISTAYDRIIGKRPNDTESLVGCLVSIVNAIDENIRWKAAPKIAAIGLALHPVISSISQFVDVIQKIASMQIADQWDKNGNPIHYLKLSPSKFKDAAKNLTDAFSTFLKDLSEGLKGFDISSLAIIQLLFPRQSGLSKLITGEKPGIGLVIKTLSDFIDVIQKMSSMSVPDKWDKDGKPISYKKLDPEKDFKSAAVNLSSAFSIFISELGKGLEDVSIKSAIVLKLLGGDISGVLQGIGAAFNPIIQIAAGKMQVGNQTVDITLPKLKQAAKDVVKVISTIITDLSAIKDKIDFDDFEGAFACVDRIIEMIGKIATSEAAKEDFPKKIKEMLIPGICGIFNFLQSTAYIDKTDSNANSFKDAMEDFVDGIKELERIQMNLFNKEFIDYSINLVNGLNEIFKFLQSTKYLAKVKSNSVVFKDVMKNTSAGINHIKPFLSSTPKQIVDLANAMKQLDAELITKEEQRTKAIQSVASNFKDMAEGVNQLNKAMTESMRLTRLYDQMKSVTSGNIIAKGVSAAVEGAGAVASKVKEALNDNKSEEQQKVKEETKQKDREELAAIIGNAVSAALTAWSESHRDLTVQFSDSPEKIFGEVYHN